MKKKFFVVMALLVATLNFISVNSSFKNIVTNTTFAVEANSTESEINEILADESYFQVKIVEANESYETLTEALSNVGANEETTIQLLQDVTLTSQLTLNSTHNIVLDLNGKKLTVVDTTNGIYNNGKLKIVDSSEEKTGTICQNTSMTRTYYAIYNYGSISIESGKLETANGIYSSSYNSVLVIGKEDVENDNPTISATKSRAITSYGKVEFYSGKTVGRYRNNIYSTNYITPAGYNVQTVYENGMYTASLVTDSIKPSIELDWAEPDIVNIDDEVEIGFYIYDNYEVKYNQTDAILSEMVFKIGDEEFEIENQNVIDVYYGEDYVGLTIKGLTGDGIITVEFPEESFYDVAGNGNEAAVIDTGIVVDNTAPENPSVIINNGATETDSNVVTLNLDAIDATEMWIKDADYELPGFEVGEFKVTIPKGFAIAELDANGKVVGIIDESEWDTISIRDIKRGLVIVELLEDDGETIYGNEFVWIPCTLDGAKDTVKFGEKRYSIVSFIYYLETSYLVSDAYLDDYNAFVYDCIEDIENNFGSSTYLTEKEFRKLINDYPEMPADFKAYLLGMFEEYIELVATNTDEEQDWIFDSVEKYGGFYIGRYEIGMLPIPKSMSMDYSKYTVVQRDKDVIYSSDYFFLEELAENLYPGMSRIVGTYSWDATLLWLEQNGVNTLFTHEWYLDDNDLVPMVSAGPYVPGVENRYDYSGSSKDDMALNIYDLAGNYFEWIDEYIYYRPTPSSIAEETKEATTFRSSSNMQVYAVVAPTFGERVLDLYNREYYRGYEESSVLEDNEGIVLGAMSYEPAARAVLYIDEVPEWVPYEEEIEFEFTEEFGEKTVEVYYKDEAGNVVGPISATINLNEAETYNPSILINDGDEETTSTNVKLTLDAKDAVEMWIKNADEGVANFEVDGIKVTVPVGFKIAKLDENGNVIGTLEETEWNTITKQDIQSGLVIVEELEVDGEVSYGNEFVWIPCTLDGANDTVKFGEKRYSIINFFAYMQSMYVAAGNEFDYYNSFVYDIEPIIREEISENLYMTKREFKKKVNNNDQIYPEDKDYILSAFDEYTKELKTYTDEEQDWIFDSVEKYGGFYIGRYEMGMNLIPRNTIDYSEQAVVQKNKEVIATPYYEMLAEAAESLYPGMSRIVGTYSWDATLLWLEQNGVNTLHTHEWYFDENEVQPIESAAPIVDGVENRLQYTGSCEQDKALNIYDLAGNYFEWIDEYIYYLPRANPVAEAEAEAEVEIQSSTASQFVRYALVTPTFGERVLDLYNREYVEPSRMNEKSQVMSYPAARAVLYITEKPEWIPYQEEMQFELTPELGEKTVEAYYKYEDGSIIGPVTDSIILTNMKSKNEISATINQGKTYTYEIESILMNETNAKIDVEPINGTVKLDTENNKIVYTPNKTFTGKENFVVSVETDAGVIEFNFTIEVKRISYGGGGGGSSSSKKEDKEDKEEEPKQENILYANDDEFRGYVGEIISTTEDWNLLSNDRATLEGTKLKVKEIVKKPECGKVYKNKSLKQEGINEDGTFYYVPDKSYTGTDEFSYVITDGENVSEEAFVKIVVKKFKLKIEDNGKHTWYIQGYEDGTVRVDNNITREEVAMIFYRLTISEDKENFEADSETYGDVETERWSNEAIAYLSEKGILQGYPDGTFKPGKAVTRAEFAAIVERYLEITGTSNVDFKDLEDDHWAKEVIQLIAAQGWMKGYTDNTFKPENNITRGETMTTLNRMLMRKLTNVESKNKFSDLDEEHWAYADVIEATSSHDYDKDDEGNEIWKSE